MSTPESLPGVGEGGGMVSVTGERGAGRTKVPPTGA